MCAVIWSLFKFGVWVCVLAIERASVLHFISCDIVFFAHGQPIHSFFLQNAHLFTSNGRNGKQQQTHEIFLMTNGYMIQILRLNVYEILFIWFAWGHLLTPFICALITFIYSQIFFFARKKGAQTHNIQMKCMQQITENFCDEMEATHIYNNSNNIYILY